MPHRDKGAFHRGNAEDKQAECLGGIEVEIHVVRRV